MRLRPWPDKTPEWTAFEAGYLVTSNGDWRSVRPVIDKERCVECGLCYLHCPDGTISRDLLVDYDFCKGCGICAKICKREAISMRREADYA
ncbi:MAG: 4Fe-4S binding protein [Candidatus Adiutrix sp.]|jgi:pyruvate ferredoxin oxidoreductase delta subunit|nr:4Fe-4S binding protein [Candidatus Adiutrix sp.]